MHMAGEDWQGARWAGLQPCLRELTCAGRALTTYSFLETPVPAIYQNVNSVYGYVRMRVNATTLITEVNSPVHKAIFLQIVH